MIRIITSSLLWGCSMGFTASPWYHVRNPSSWRVVPNYNDDNGPQVPNKISCTILRCSSSNNLNNNDNNDNNDNNNTDNETICDPFMASLRNRMIQVSDRDTKIPLVVLDSMLPRQVMKIQVANNPLFRNLIKSRLDEETPYFGILGVAKSRTGQYVHMTHGVEVGIVGKPLVLGNDKKQSSENQFQQQQQQGSSILLELKAGRRFQLMGEVTTAMGTNQGWTEGRVQFLSSAQQEAEEEKNSESLEERMALVRAMQSTRAFTSPNMNMEQQSSLVDQWIQLAKQRERQPGQIDQILNDLGSIPPIEEPSERAFWVGALINPIPAMGVAMEIRPALLMAKTAEQRTEIALDGILRSIRHMDGTAPMW